LNFHSPIIYSVFYRPGAGFIHDIRVPPGCRYQVTDSVLTHGYGNYWPLWYNQLKTVPGITGDVFGVARVDLFYQSLIRTSFWNATRFSPSGFHMFKRRIP